jgi:alcohol dehydrogenase (cytochrome c)
MKKASYAFAFLILFATCALTYSQSRANGPTGTWRVEGDGTRFRWEAVLRADGPNLIGAVSSCNSITRAFEIFEGEVNGETITFKCRSLDGQRTVTLNGRVEGDEIDFTWELQVQDGGNPGANDEMFGVSAPRRFTAKRVPDATDVVAEAAAHVLGPLTFERILHSDREPQNWLTYSGTVLGWRYSRLTQITPANVKNLELAWLWQGRSSWWEATPLVSSGVLYTVQPPNDVVALDAATGRVLWTYPYTPTGFRNPQPVNRGLAILGSTLFLGTLDAHLLAINAHSGKLIWNTTVANAADPSCQDGSCYAITHAPLVVKDKVIVGSSGGEGRVRGFVAAFDVITGKEVWRFWTIPAPGEPGNETWSGDSWKTGGAPVWNTGSYDADLNLTYWGIGNPAPGEDPNSRLGDNLYSDSVVALDADTGKLKWYYQFTPHDDNDWDATQIPVLTDIEWQGRLRKVMLWANRNGLMYVLDRATGQFLMGKPFVEVNWMSGFDQNGRPTRVPPKPGTQTLPMGGKGATNWIPPSYSASTGLFYVPSMEEGANPRYGAIRAFDPHTGEKRWEFKKDAALFNGGVLTTASDLLFTGVRGDFGPWTNIDAARLADGYFYAVNAQTGELLWQMGLAGSIQSGPMSYSVGGKQYVAVAAGNTLFAFGLRQ